MKICLVTPAPHGSRKGNRVTALRWAKILRSLGHRVAVEQEYRGQRCDLAVTLHARRSFPSIERFSNRHPNLPLFVALTGTDLYGDIHEDPDAQRSLEMATRLVVLQPMGVGELPEHLRDKARVIFQSAEKPPGKFCPQKGVFEVCVLGHLRPVKDPFRAAKAARLLPPASRLRVTHIGRALSAEAEAQARAEAASNPRYCWLRELPRWKALRRLARSRLLVLTSHMEGGANVLSEAIAASVPILSSRIPSSIGVLGPNYAGFFSVGDTNRLAELLLRAETGQDFYRELQDSCRGLQPLVEPARETRSWQELLEEVERAG